MGALVVRTTGTWKGRCLGDDMCLYYVSTRSAVAVVICCKQVSPENTLADPAKARGCSMSTFGII